MKTSRRRKHQEQPKEKNSDPKTRNYQKQPKENPENRKTAERDGGVKVNQPLPHLLNHLHYVGSPERTRWLRGPVGTNNLVRPPLRFKERRSSPSSEPSGVSAEEQGPTARTL